MHAKFAQQLIENIDGTLAAPLRTVSTHRNILASLLSWELDLTCMAVLKGRTKSKKNGSKAYTDSTLLGMPLFHVNGLLAVLLASYRKQRKVVAMYKWDPMRAVELVEREKIISFVGTPAMTGDIMLAAQDTGHDVGSLLAVGGGGAALNRRSRALMTHSKC
ncbi:MAG: AMP-binding protein [Sphingomonadales bacterium]|nr:AMP-binding protein [Sphingomonadales bacterium]